MEEETSTDCLGLVMNFIEHTLRLCNPTCVLGVLKVVVPHNVSLKQLIFLSKKKKKEKKKYVPVVSEALIGEGKNLGRFFLISLKF